MFDYLKDLCRSALPATLVVLGFQKEHIDWFKFCLTGIAFILTGTLAISLVAASEWIFGILLFLGLMLALPALFVWQLFVAAYEVQENLRAEIEALQTPAWNFDELVARKLRDLLDEGNELIASQPIAEKHQRKNAWVENLLSWCSSAQDLVSKNLPRRDAVGFMTVSLSPKADQSSAELEHILRARLDTLRQITTRYMDFSPS